MCFKIIKELKPDYSYILKDKRFHKFNFRKNKINIDVNKTEHEYMLENNIFRIYDSGKIKWKYEYRF